MTYDQWKTTDPADDRVTSEGEPYEEFLDRLLDQESQDNPEPAEMEDLDRAEQ